MKYTHHQLFTEYLWAKRSSGGVGFKTWIKERGFAKCLVCRKYTDKIVFVRKNDPPTDAYTCEEDEQNLRDWWGINREGDPK